MLFQTKHAVIIAALSALSGFSEETAAPSPMIETVHCQNTAFNSPHLASSAWKTDLTFLYMKAYEDGLEYADQLSTTLGTSFALTGKTLYPPFKWSPGCRVLIGYQFGERDFWDLNLSWTYFHTHTHDSHRSADLAVADFPPLWASIFLGSSASFAAVNWRLNLNMFDLTLGKNFFLSHAFAIHPFAGLLTTWVNQNYKSNYQGVFYFIDPMGTQFSLSQPTSFSATNEYWGIGPLAGCDLFFHFSSNWGLFGKFSGSLLWSKFNVKENAEGGRPINAGGGNIILFPAELNQTNLFHTARLFADTMIGFFYEKMLNCNRSRIGVQAGYECAYFLNQNEFFNTVVVTDSTDLGSNFARDNGFLNHVNKQGTLSLVGFVLRVLFDF